MFSHCCGMCGALLVAAVCVLMQRSSGIPARTDSGCKKWEPNANGKDICCEACHSGHRLLKKCGPNPSKLCALCDPGTYVEQSNSYRCSRCSECIGAQVKLKDCTPSADTVCGCAEGLLCGDRHCSFCLDKCEKGHERTDDGSCKPCPEGTFNDASRNKCKPWSTKCPKPGQRIVRTGDAFSDVMCEDAARTNEDQTWLVVLLVVTGIILMIIITTVSVMILKRRKKFNINQDTKKPEFSTYPEDDDPRTLIAVESSFHEAEQEQGGSSESVDSFGKLVT